MEFFSFFLKLKRITAYLYHHVGNGEKKIIEDVGENGESPEQYHQVQVERNWKPEDQGRS